MQKYYINNLLFKWFYYRDPTPGTDFKWDEATSNSFRHLSLTTSPTMKDDDFQQVIIIFSFHTRGKLKQI